MLRLTEIDELLRPEHFDLRPEDKCYALREYTAYQGYAYSETNNLIQNLKKSPLKRDQPGWNYKGRAIDQVARELRDALNPAWLKSATLVPMPPSKIEGDPEYDDRILQVLRRMAGTDRFDVRQLIRQTANMDPAHAGTQSGKRRPMIHELVNAYQINETVAQPPPSCVGLFDDVLTKGTHFRAAKRVLQARYGVSLEVVGIFAARTVFLKEDEDEEPDDE